MNHPDCGQRERVRLVLERVLYQSQDGAGLVLGKDEPRSGGSRNLPIKN